MLRRISDERLVQMTYLAEKLTNDEEVLDGIKTVRGFLQDPNHPTIRLFRQVLDYLSPRNRQAVFNTLFNHAWFIGGKQRDRCERERGFRPPFIMILSPTWRCNLKCAGCYTLGYQRHPGLSRDLVMRVLEECEELGIHFITVLGGEPFMYPHLFQIYTNGTLMDREKAQRLAELGNASVVCSIEGYEEETDKRRGKGVYRKIMDAMDHLREARVLFGASATVTRHNVETVSSPEFIDMLMDKGSVAQMYFLYLPVNGKADFSLMVTPEQRNHLRKRVMETRRTRPLFVLDFWNDGPHVEGCIAGGRRYFHLNANGDVEPCVYTHIAVDNIKNVSLAEALDSELFRAIRRRQPHNRSLFHPQRSR
jgi:MoaA/NifB/PqqE/SkfB family radical SAM enzyme